jgi:hypothetical protein
MAKCQLQRWDEPIDENETEKWAKLRGEMMSLKIEVDRCLIPASQFN